MAVFSETQRALRIWLIALMGLVWSAFIVFTVLAIHSQIIQGMPFGDKPMPDNVLIIFLISFNLLFMFLEALIVMLRLEVTVDSSGISYSYFPFLSKRFIAKNEIEYAWVRKYKPIKEYGGWGYRTMFKQKAYNVWGKWGIQIVQKNKKLLLLGTQKPEEAAKVLQNLGFTQMP
jgi:hypothetical protein